MRTNERGDPCTHPVRPPDPNNSLIRGPQVSRALESGSAVFDDKGIKGVLPIEDADEGELVVGEEEAQAVDTVPTYTLSTDSVREGRSRINLMV